MTAATHIVCALSCDRDGCGCRITINHDVTQEQAAAAAFALGWQCELGTDRWRHWCPTHKEKTDG